MCEYKIQVVTSTDKDAVFLSSVASYKDTKRVGKLYF